MDGETKTGQDSLHDDGRTSPEKVSPSTTEKSYTEAELAERHSKLDKTISQLTKERDASRQDLESTKTRLDEILRRKEEEELEAARGDPDKLNSYQEKKRFRDEKEALVKQRRELEQEKLTHQVEIEEARATKREIAIFDLAEKYGADASTLKDLNLDLEQTEKIAKTIGTKNLETTTTTSKVKHDSGMTIGGGIDYDDLTPREKIEKGLEKAKEKSGR